jgi:hypothetical protein
MRINKLFSRLSTGALLATVVTVAANPAQAGTLTTIDFDENVGVGSNPLSSNPLERGPKLDNLWSDYGLRMDSNVKELWLYDSNCEDASCTGGDEDLATGKGENKHGKYKSPEQGKVLIIQENNTNKADDYAPKKNKGEKEGKITFDFTDDVGVLFNSISLLDFDDPGDPIFNAVFADGTTTGDFFYNSNFFKEKEGKNANKVTDNRFVRNSKEDSPYIRKMKLLSTNWDGTQYVKGDNSLRKYDFNFGDKRVSEFSITLPGSGAVTGLNYYRENPEDLVKKVPEPTSILGLVAISGLAASSLKRKRKSSII